MKFILLFKGWSRKLFSIDEERQLLELFRTGSTNHCGYLERHTRRKLKNQLVLNIKQYLHICYINDSFEVPLIPYTLFYRAFC